MAWMPSFWCQSGGIVPPQPGPYPTDLRAPSSSRDDQRVAKQREPVKLTIRIPAELHEQAVALAEADHRSLASWLIVAVERAIAAAKK